MSRSVRWIISLICFAAALVVGWLAQADFNSPGEHHRRVVVEVVSMMVLASPLLVLLRWRWGKR